MAARKPRRETVVAAVKRDLKELAKRDPKLAKSGLAISALRLAESLDDPDNSATSKAMCSRALLDTFDRLRQLAPEAKRKDSLDELSRRRQTRLARSAKA